MALLVAVAPAAQAQALRKLGDMQLRLVGLTAAVDPLNPTVPRNIASGVRIRVQGGGQTLTPADAVRLLGPFELAGELSGPGLGATVTLREAVTASTTAPDLILPLPALAVGGDYLLSNLRLVALGDGRPVLDVTPTTVPVTVIDQVLVTSVATRALTLQEIRDKGIVLDSDDYLGFEFTLGLRLESRPINVSFPVVFGADRLPVPSYISAPSLNLPATVPVQVPTIVPMLLDLPVGANKIVIDGQERDIRIPSVLVIPGDVGFLRQFFSAQLFVANGAPGTSNLTVRDITGTMVLPPGADLVLGSTDDPLSRAETVRGVQPLTMPVRGLGPDGTAETADDDAVLSPGEQGQAEFLVRGDLEGFHNLAFDIAATLDGLPTGSVPITGRARGGVLVRNPFFDVSFAVPSVVRRDEPFTLYATVTNKGQGLANAVSMTLDAARMSGARLTGDASRSIDTLAPGDAKTLAFTFIAERTGQVTASYLKFEGPGATGNLQFTIGVGERGVRLSPDTLVLPSQIDVLPRPIVDAALRVLGQAWSVANAPLGTLPAGVRRISKQVVTDKALALAEAGLRQSLGQPALDALRDLLVDFHGGSPVDAGFDQLLRETDAGQAFDLAVGASLAPAVTAAGSAAAFERAFAQVAASGLDVVSFSVAPSGGPMAVALVDAAGRQSRAIAQPDAMARGQVRSAVVVPLGNAVDAPVFGLVTAPQAGPYAVQVEAAGAGALDMTVTFPSGSGSFIRGIIAGVAVQPGSRVRLPIDAARGSPVVEIDLTGDGTFDTTAPLVLESITPQAPQLIAATIVGPETLPTAGTFGKHIAFLFDRVIDAAPAAVAANYAIPQNAVLSARRQLSGRLVFATLAQPEGRFLPSTVSISGMRDLRGTAAGVATAAIGSRLTTVGAVVSGRIVAADGAPVVGADVYFLANTDWTECRALPTTVHRVATDATGSYAFRYVPQDPCGIQWQVQAQDPVTRALRSVAGLVRYDGERVVADLQLLGRGAVTGTVRTGTGTPVPGATVVAVSLLDQQFNGQTTTDGLGRFTINDLAVGGVSLRALSGVSSGTATAQIAGVGATATADITLNSGIFSVAGTVRRIENGVVSPVGGAYVVVEVPDPFRAGSPFTPVGYAQTSATGAYVLSAIPAGAYRLRVTLDTGDSTQLTGTATPGDVLTGRDLVVSVLRSGQVSGVVRFAGGAPAPLAVVTLGGRGVQAAADGTFTLVNVPAQGGPQQIFAYTADGSRRGVADVLLTTPGQIVSNVVVTLAGAGTLDVLLLDGTGQPVPNQQVYVTRAGLRVSGRQCLGLAAANTNAAGHAILPTLEVGAIRVRSVRQVAGLIDVAQADTSLPYDGATASTVLRFPGHGVVSGVVLAPDGQPVHGADVEIRSRIYDPTGCELVGGVSHVVRTNTLGQFRATGVPVGPVSVRATQAFFTAPAGASGVLATAGQELTFTLRMTNTMGGVLSGTVLQPDGTTPVGPGVQVTANGPLPDVVVATDASGHFEFPAVLPAGSYGLTVRDPGTGGLSYDIVYLNVGRDLVFNPRLTGRNTVRVRVVDGAGVPVAAAAVKLRENGFPNFTFESAVQPATQGVVAFQGVHEGPISLEASDVLGRGGRASAWVTGDGQTIEVTVSLTVTGTVRGRFLRADGTTPVALGSVRLLAAGRAIGEMTTSLGTDPGRYEFLHVPAGPVRLEALDPTTGRTGVAAATLSTEGQIVDLDVRAQGLGTVSGRVTGLGVSPDGASVEVVSGTFRVNTTADATGQYAVPGVPEGAVTVTASFSGGTLAGVATGTLAGDGATLTLDVALRAAGVVSGVVREADGVTPAAPAVVSIRVGDLGGGTQTTTTDAAGSFSFLRVPAGAATIDVTSIGTIDRGRATVAVTGNATSTVTLQLNGVGALQGRTLTAGGQPVAGTLTVRGTGAFPYTHTVAVGPTGTFTLPAVLAGPYSASLTSVVGGFTLRGSAAGAVVAGQAAALDVALQPTASVTGRVLRADGTTAAVGAEVTVIAGASGAVRVTVPVLAGGTFRADGIPLGVLTIRVDDPFTGGVGLVSGLTAATDGQLLTTPDIVLDDTPLRALSATPADGALDVALSTPIVMTFSDPIANLTAAVNGIVVRRNGVGWPRLTNLSPDGRTVTITPQPVGLWTGWPDASEITFEITPALTDIFGRPAAAFTSRFRTVDVSGPSVVTVAPLNAAIQVPGTSAVVVSFSEPVAPITNLATLITVTAAGVPVGGTTTLTAPNVATFVPDAPWPDNTIYTVTVSGARDQLGNTQATTFTSSFATTDTVPPVVTPGSPTPGSWTNNPRPQVLASLVDPVSGIDAIFDTLTVDGVPVPATQGTSVVFGTPVAPLADGAHTAAASARDRAGNTGSTSWSFNIDTVAPEPAVVTGVTNGQSVAGTVTIGATSTDAASGVFRTELYRNGQFMAQLHPPAFSTPVAVNAWGQGDHVLTARALDVAGNWSAFGPAVTVTVGDTTAPVVTAVTPLANARQVSVNTLLTAVFSEPIQDVNLASVFTVARNAAPVVGTVARSAPNVLTFTPSAPLQTDATYTATVVNVVDLAGNVRTFPHTWTFTTVDTQPPTLTYADTTVYTSALPQIDVLASDALSPLSGTTAAISVDGVALTTTLLSQGFGAFTLRATPTSPLTGGVHTLTATVADTAGNAATITRSFTVQLAPASIRVRYLTTTGAPVAGAQVSYEPASGNQQTLVTNAAGDVVFANAVVGNFTVTAYPDSSSRRAYSQASGTLTAADFGLVREITLTESPIGTLRVRVLAADGVTPVPFAQLFNLEVGEGSVSADEFGIAVFSGVTGLNGHLEAMVFVPQGQGTVTQSGTMTSDGEVLDITVVIPVGIIRGVITFEDGSPATAPRADGTQLGWPYIGVPDPSVPGGYVIAGMLAGDVDVTAQDLDSGLSSGPLTVTVVDVQNPVIANFVLPPTGTVSGTVRTASGVPMPGLDVFVYSDGGGAGRSVVTDAQGAYTVLHVVPGSLSVTAVTPTSVSAFAGGVLAGPNTTAQIDVTFLPFGTVTGVVRNAAGVPVSGASVTVSHAGGTTYAVTDAAGAYNTPYVSVGDVFVDANVPGTLVYGSAVGQLTTDGGTIAVDVELAPSGVVSGVVLDEVGQPVAGAQVDFLTFGFVVRQVVADAAGAYSLPDTPLGTWQVRATSGNFSSADVDVTLTSQGEVATATLALRATSLTVTVLNADSSPAAGARVLVAVPGSFSFDHEVIADSNGVAVVPRWPVGTLGVRAISGGRLRDATVTLVNGVPATVTLTLP
ncbi:carboxypeptidase regulatory-like domain-containing protein [Luteitalea sp.]|uniref:carboxypeptidase regulatory-like domain-containing protein n=1 Tax=Luteitalea sp. TaxID=2004800 RepID=UPI0025BD9FCD|nr:carboxypeptidase regulatory-like domain-containing protein [Luteitalea sp.]